MSAAPAARFYRSVYVATDDANLCKVGMSAWPAARCRELKRILRRPVNLVYESRYTTLASQVETCAHSALARFAEGGEWFATTAEQAIAAVQTAFEELDAHSR